MGFRILADENQLLNKLKLAGHYSLLGPKPQDLTFQQIVAEVSVFLREQENYRISLSFGNEVGEDLEDENDGRFDPIALYAEFPENLDAIQMYVDSDIRNFEAELLARSDTSLYAYNTLVFGAAIRLAHSENPSPQLREFLVNHLIDPKPPKLTKKQGRPKKTNDDDLLKYHAIKFAVAHGLKPTRNDEHDKKRVSTTRNDEHDKKISACDAVFKAACHLYQKENLVKFSAGYGYETLKKLWHSNKSS